MTAWRKYYEKIKKVAGFVNISFWKNACGIFDLKEMKHQIQQCDVFTYENWGEKQKTAFKMLKHQIWWSWLRPCILNLPLASKLWHNKRLRENETSHVMYPLLPVPRDSKTEMGAGSFLYNIQKMEALSLKKFWVWQVLLQVSQKSKTS